MVRVRYVFFVTVRVRYVGTLFELKLPDFSHISPAFLYIEAKNSWNRRYMFELRSLIYRLVILKTVKIASN